MIQRIQSLLLLLAAGTYGSFFGLPLMTSDTIAEGFLSDQSFEIQDHIALIALALTGGALAFLAIFLFKNRRLQLILSYLSLIIGLLAIPGVGYFLLSAELREQMLFSAMNVGAGMFLPLVIAILILWAISKIKKDDKLVRSMDRLR
ncbi:MAG TPA: DUF4293 domain-containing protein [Saprospiraceae bacterium]|nr:DUF4293 domain-containing protein [Saprospiraceae bacterium]